MAVMEIQPPNPFTLDLPNRLFGTIYADPPWPLDQPNTRASRRRIHYDRMSAAEIIDMGEKVKAVSHPDAHLWLWTTNAHLPIALDVVKAWGFTYKTLATWRKTKIGTGWWLRSRTEHLILAAKSTNMRHNPGNFTTEITGEWKGHSKKPEGVRAMIEQLSPGPYLEIFNRQAVESPLWATTASDAEPGDAFGQYHLRPAAVPDPSDGKVRGVGGLEIHPNQTYTYVQKVLTGTPVIALDQKARRVKIQIGDEKPKWVSIDKLRQEGWTP